MHCIVYILCDLNTIYSCIYKVQIQMFKAYFVVIKIVDLLFIDKQLTLYSEYYHLMSAFIFICNQKDKESINKIVLF